MDRRSLRRGHERCECTTRVTGKGLLTTSKSSPGDIFLQFSTPGKILDPIVLTTVKLLSLTLSSSFSLRRSNFIFDTENFSFYVYISFRDLNLVKDHGTICLYFPVPTPLPLQKPPHTSRMTYSHTKNYRVKFVLYNPDLVLDSDSTGGSHCPV